MKFQWQTKHRLLEGASNKEAFVNGLDDKPVDLELWCKE
jgi:hypothetical protein